MQSGAKKAQASRLYLAEYCGSCHFYTGVQKWRRCTILLSITISTRTCVLMGGEA